jgi:hypothetical protein
LDELSVKKIIAPNKVFPIFAGSAELSPFHQCYSNKETVLRAAVGRLYVHYNGENVADTYWALQQREKIAESIDHL